MSDVWVVAAPTAGETLERALGAGAVVPVPLAAVEAALLSDAPELAEAEAVPVLVVVELAVAVAAPLGPVWAPALVGGGTMGPAEPVDELAPVELEEPVCGAPVEPAADPPPPEPPEGSVFLGGSYWWVQVLEASMPASSGRTELIGLVFVDGGVTDPPLPETVGADDAGRIGFRSGVGGGGVAEARSVVRLDSRVCA